MSITDLTTSKDDSIRVAFDAKHKIHVQNFKTPAVIHGINGGTTNGVTKTPEVINLFPEVEIQANKSFTIDTYVKAYPAGSSSDSDWMGLNVATNLKIDGVWYSLGNSGRVVSANLGGSGMATYVSKKYVDFKNLLARGYAPRHLPYTIQVELVGSCQATGSAYISINTNQDPGGTLPTGETGVESIADQNFTTVIIEETD